MVIPPAKKTKAPNESSPLYLTNIKTVQIQRVQVDNVFLSWNFPKMLMYKSTQIVVVVLITPPPPPPIENTGKFLLFLNSCVEINLKTAFKYGSQPEYFYTPYIYLYFDG